MNIQGVRAFVYRLVHSMYRKCYAPSLSDSVYSPTSRSTNQYIL